MAKQETIIDISIYSQGRVYCSSSMLYTGSWMKQTLTDIQVEYDEPIPIYCDNTSSIRISKKPNDSLQEKALDANWIYPY